MSKKIDIVDEKVKSYYEANWSSIANCYDVDQDGLPIDAAWYRRRIYNKILEEKRPSSVLDVGCGGGQTVLDALAMGSSAIGIEPIKSLVDHGQEKLTQAGFSRELITQGDASDISNYDDDSFDLVAMLSVIPHIPMKDWPSLHSEIARVLKPGGYCVIAYRNELFDLYTVNRFTHDFFMKNFFGSSFYSTELQNELSVELESFIPFNKVPPANHTESSDKRFGDLERPKSNPLIQAEYLKKYGLDLEKNYFCNIHPVLPNSLLFRTIDAPRLKHSIELDLFDAWQGNFMGSMFVTVARKP